MSRFGTYRRFIRPFTLLVPASGMVAGALVALGAPPKWESDWTDDPMGIALRILAGGFLAAALNAFSNGVNQIYDVEVDRVNKPERMLPSGRMSVAQAWGVSLVSLIIALALAAAISLQCLLIVGAATVLVYIYSAPPLRTKSRGAWANLTIAIPRGTLLVVCGWSAVKDAWSWEPWLVGLFFGLFFLGAVSTKDFSDMEGDRAGGCRTLPIIYGVRTATWMIAPFLVLPFLLIVPASQGSYLTGNPTVLTILGGGLAAWGLYIAWLLVRTGGSPGAADRSFENHPSWKHMYLLTLCAQIGFAVAYLIG